MNADHIFRFQNLGDRLADTARRVAELNPNDRLFDECLFQCESYSFYRELGFTVQVETPYERWEPGVERQPCDLRLDSTAWMELKVVAACSQGEHAGVLHHNFDQRMGEFVVDLNDRLNQRAGPSHMKIGLLIAFFDFEDEEMRGNMIAIHPGDPGESDTVLNLVMHHPRLRWRGFDLHTTIGIWAWEGRLRSQFARAHQ